MKHIISDILNKSIRAKEAFVSQNAAGIETGAVAIADALKNGHKVLLFGNGGSAADCQHIAAEFVNRFQMERPPLAAIALTTDTSVITSIGNDYTFDEVFAKQVAALGKQGDIAIAISTSGNSPNVIRATQKAKSMGITIIGFSGDGGRLKTLCDIPYCVAADSTARIQEVHILLAHILCDLAERILFNA